MVVVIAIMLFILWRSHVMLLPNVMEQRFVPSLAHRALELTGRVFVQTLVVLSINVVLLSIWRMILLKQLSAIYTTEFYVMCVRVFVYKFLEAVFTVSFHDIY